MGKWDALVKGALLHDIGKVGLIGQKVCVKTLMTLVNI